LSLQSGGIGAIVAAAAAVVVTMLQLAKVAGAGATCEPVQTWEFKVVLLLQLLPLCSRPKNKRGGHTNNTCPCIQLLSPLSPLPLLFHPRVYCKLIS